LGRKEKTPPRLKETDPDIYLAIQSEKHREKEKIILIASENYASRAVLEALGSVFTNKYAEGYPRHRYYGGCEFVDDAEELAIERAKKLFSAEHVNVQPHSGSQANMAVYFSVLNPGGYTDGNEFGPWRAFNPRKSGEFFGDALPRCLLRGEP